jgi:hypothetical protein
MPIGFPAAVHVPMNKACALLLHGGYRKLCSPKVVQAAYDSPTVFCPPGSTRTVGA